MFLIYRQPNGWADRDQTWHTDSSWLGNCFRQISATVKLGHSAVGERMEAPIRSTRSAGIT